LRAGGTRRASRSLNSLLTSHASWTLRTDVTAIAFRASGPSNTGNALDSLRASLAGWSRLSTLASVTLRPRDTGDTLRTYIAAVALNASHAGRPSDAGSAGDALRSRHSGHASHTLRAGRSDFASRTGNAGWALRTSHAGHALQSLRASKANLRPRCEITGKPPELVVTQRQDEHSRFTPQLRDRVTLCDVGNAAVSALAVPCLVRCVRVRCVERHDRSEYVRASDLRHVTTRLTVPVIGYVER
jgi:hypothetical protein